MASKTPLFGPPRTISLLLICLIGYTPVALKPQSDTETEIRVLIQRYFTAYERKDLNGLSSLWNEKSPEQAATMQSFQQTFAANTTIEMKRLDVPKITFTGDKARACVVVELKAIDAKTGKRSEELAKKNRTLHLTNERGVWRVWRDVSSEEELAAAISAATTEEERRVLLEADKELITVELRKALVTLGIGFVTRGSYAQAMSIFKLTLTIAQQLDDKIGMATSLRGMAHIYGAQGNYAQALENDQKSLAISEELRDKLGITRTLNHIGSVHQSQGNYTPALEKYQKSLAISEELGDKPGIASALLNVGNIHLLQGSYTQALEAYKKSLAISEEAREKLVIVRALNNIGNIHELQGDYTQALEYHGKSLAMSQELNDKFGIATAIRNIGHTYQLQGSYTDAIEYTQKSLTISNELGDRAGAANALRNLGIIERLLGNYTKAFEYSQKSLTIFEQIGDRRGIASTLHNLGNVHWSQANYSQALDHYRKSLTISEELSDRGLVAGTLNNIGEVHRFQGDYTQALANYRRSLKIAEEMGDKSATEMALNNIGVIHQLQGSYTDALENYQKSLKISEEIGDKAAVARDLNNIGEIYKLQANYTQAIETGNQAALRAEKMGALDTLWEALTIVGQAYQALNKTQQAEKAFSDAIAAIEQLRDQVAGGEQQRQHFFEGKVSPYYAMVDLHIGQKNPEKALVFAERAKARAVLDVLQSGQTIVTRSVTVEEREREQMLNSELVSLNTQIYREKSRGQPDQTRLNDLTGRLKTARLQIEAFQINLYAAHPELRIQRGDIQPITIKQLDSLIPDSSTALLQYVVRENKTHLFVLARSKAYPGGADLKLFTLSITQKDLTDRVEQFRTRLSNRDFTADDLGGDLYSLLLKPASAELKGKTSLVIVPDGVLWHLSFQALKPSKDRYLIEDAGLSYAPSFTTLREILKPKAKRTNGTGGGSLLLAFGNPSIGNETIKREKSVFMDEKLEPLPEAERQVKMLAQVYGPHRSKVYLQQDATEERLKAEAGNYRILHLATHGILNDASPMYSHVLLSQPGVGSKEDGILEAWEMMNLNVNADVVVLSACDTARGRVGAGEGVIGLTWALFVAGSPTVVASQWKVEVQSTTELIVEFHRNLKWQIDNPGSKMTKAKALRQAALKLLRSEQYRHPFYWAGFVIIGNGG